MCKFFFFSTYGWNFTDTYNFTLQHHRESRNMNYGATLQHIPVLLCALEHLQKEFTGQIFDDPHNPDPDTHVQH